MKLGRMLSLLALPVLLAPGATAAPLGAAVAPAVSADAESNSPNFELVARIPNIGGSDIEFFTHQLETYRDADGQEITPEEPVERHFAFVGSYGQPVIVDITEPEQPFIASRIPNCGFGQGDPQVNVDGTLAAIAKQGSGTCRITATGKTVTGDGSAFIDISDVYDPQVVGWAPVTGGSHNHTFHPSGKYMYVSLSLGDPVRTVSRIPIFDISDPTAPKFVRNFETPGNGPHDVRFSEDGKRAYVASVSTYYILNTENPENPTLISTIVPPGGTIGHDTLVTPDKAFLILGDEAGGGAPFPCPGGAIFAYDIRNEATPIFLGLAEAGGGPVTGRTLDDTSGATGAVGGCTSHVMDLNPDKKSLTLGWYVLGTRTFDFSSFYNADGSPKSAPIIAAAWGKNGVGLVETGYIVPPSTSTWAAKQYHRVPGYIFSNAGGSGGGLYVTKIKAPSY